VAKLLEEFTPEERLLPTLDAIVTVFDRCGERKDRHRARIKFLIERIGLEAFREMVLAERQLLPDEFIPCPSDEGSVEHAAAPALDSPPFQVSSFGEAFRVWWTTNVVPQRQPGYAVVQVTLPIGDLSPEQFRALAEIARAYGGEGVARTTRHQNIIFRFVRLADVPKVYDKLVEAGLNLPGAETLADVTACPGAETCQLGITGSRQLALALEKMIRSNGASDPALRSIQVKISGCPNSCGQHHIANIGFFGGARKINGRQVPHYQMLLGGSARPGEANFGQAILRLPAKRIPEAVEHLLHWYRDERQQGEDFNAFISRMTPPAVKARLTQFTQVATYEENPDLYRDWGEDEDFVVRTGTGECASGQGKVPGGV